MADKLREAADLLEAQGANPFRVSAYRRAADTLAGLGEGADAVLDREGVEGLVKLPAIGRGIASAIQEMVRGGRWQQLERLRGTSEPEDLFQAVPGVGPALARRIHDALHIDTLEALELAAHDGRLGEVEGIGERRAAMIRASLANILARRPPRRMGGYRGETPAKPEPDIADLLAVDREYRDLSDAGKLPKIAPRRFNPQGEAWLPILHTDRGEWHFTVLFSNTARAHDLNRVFDWVVIYFHGRDQPEGQRTVVTEQRGSLAGKRVVRGREGECRDHYRDAAELG